MAGDRLRCVLVGVNAAHVRRLARYNNLSAASNPEAVAAQDGVALDAAEQTIVTNIVVCSGSQCQRIKVTWELWDALFQTDESHSDRSLRHNLYAQFTKAIVVVAATEATLAALLNDVQTSSSSHLPVIIADTSAERVLSSSVHTVVPFDPATGDGAVGVLQQVYETTTKQSQSTCHLS